MIDLESNENYHLLLQMTPGTMKTYIYSSHPVAIKVQVVNCYIKLIVKRDRNLGDLGIAFNFSTLFPLRSCRFYRV
jgi:hypothetical protein